MPRPFASEQLAQAQKAQIDGLLTLAQTAFTGLERLAALNLNTARSLLEDSAGSAQALLGAKDIQSFIAIQGSLLQPAVDKTVVWSRSAYDIGTDTREALDKTLKSQIAEVNQNLDSALEELVKQVPDGSAAATSASVSAIRSAIGAASTTYEAFSKAAKQVSDYAESNLPPAAKPTQKARKAA